MNNKIANERSRIVPTKIFEIDKDKLSFGSLENIVKSEIERTNGLKVSGKSGSIIESGTCWTSHYSAVNPVEYGIAGPWVAGHHVRDIFYPRLAKKGNCRQLGFSLSRGPKVSLR
jgi:hypothetical protein